jgi:hypothetical protein
VRGRLTWGPVALRVLGCLALLVLLKNPISSRLLPGTAPPLVLLDASLSMAGHGGRWAEALDSARALAGGGGGGGGSGTMWRFGARVTAFDSTAPHDGATLLAPALTAAAARSGPVALVTDGAIGDVGAVAPDLLQRMRVVVLPRPAFRDGFVAGVAGPSRLAGDDTLTLRVAYGTAGRGEAGRGRGRSELIVSAEGRRLAARAIALPDSGIVSTDIQIPAARFPHSGWFALDVRLTGAPDAEPRDDARLFVVDVSPAPSVVILASPPDWDLRFLARTLADVARMPVRMFVETESGSAGRWRDAATLAPVATADVQHAARSARLLILGGDPARFGRIPAPAGTAVILWPTLGGQPGDWYLDRPLPSPLAPSLAGLAWDSLPPAGALQPPPRDSAGVVALAARLARRGRAQPVLLLSETGGARRASFAATGLYRWAFRGGASGEAYRTLVAGLTDWLLAGSGSERTARAVPDPLVVANGLPLSWRWTGAGTPRDLVVALAAAGAERRDTLRFDASGAASLLVPPGAYRYTLEGGAERGMVAVDTYSDEWRPAPPLVDAQPGESAGRYESVGMRERWWLFFVAIGLFAAEWVWRRRQGLP